MWFTRLAIARPILIWMFLAAIALLGVQAYFRLPAELYPRVDIPTLTVTTIYPGAGPPEVETQISKPLEDTVGAVPGVKEVYSSSQSNVSIISMNFNVGTNLDVASANVRGRIEALREHLPTGANLPVVAKLDINAQPVYYFGLSAPSQSARQLRSLADNILRPRLQRVAGVASVQVLGGEQREIHVDVDGLQLTANKLTIEDVVNALKASGRDIPGGAVTQGSRETDVRLSSAFTSLDAIRNTQILSRSAEEQRSRGSMEAGLAPPLFASPAPPLTIADVAKVTDAQAERSAINRINGHEGVSIVLIKTPDDSAVTVVNEVTRALAQMKPELPADFKIVVLRNDGETVSDALSDVNMSLVLGALLAVIVILLFLHNLRGTFIVSLAIPACLVATFLVMYVASFTLNQMTLLALSLSVGILVDDSIVVLESITRHLGMGKTPAQAALDGRAEIGFADITTTLVDVVVFVPIAFMGGIVGGFFKQFGLCIATATLFSLVISFSVTPMLAARWYKQNEDLERKQGLYAAFDRLYLCLETVYRRVIRFALRFRWPTLGIGVAALALVFAISFTRLGFEFMPGTDQGLIAISIEMPPGTSLAVTEQAAERVEQAVRGRQDIAATVTNVGQVLGGFGTIPQQGPQYAQINLRLIEKASLLDRFRSGSARLRHESDEQITTALRRDIQPLAQAVSGKISVAAVRSVVGISLPVVIEMRGADVTQLTRFAETVRDHLRGFPGILDPDVSTRSGKPEVRAQIDPSRAAQVNIPSSLAGAILRDSIAGNTDSIFRENAGESRAGSVTGSKEAREYPIRVRLTGVQRDDPAEVGDIIVGYDTAGQPVTLADVSDIKTEVGPSAIERTDGQRLVSVTANLAPGVALGNIQQKVQREILDKLPHEGIDIHWSGDAETLDDNAIPFATALILAALLVYFVMASLFNNLGTPFVIMFALPMALVGALGALVLTGESLSLVAAIGIIMLVGLMGRNAILLLDYTNTLRGRGLERNEALIEAGATRLRPILMTTTATIFGMLPVALRIGKASEIRAPMAIVVIGGLIVSTLLTLLIIPVLYSLYDDWTDRRPSA